MLVFIDLLLNTAVIIIFENRFIDVNSNSCNNEIEYFCIHNVSVLNILDTGNSICRICQGYGLLPRTLPAGIHCLAQKLV